MIFNLTKTEKDKAQITIYGPIKDFSSFFSSGGASPDKVMRDLDELANAKEITVRINSGGGSAFAGLAIFELLRAHGAKIITRNDGLAASAASIILMAGDVIIMGTGSMTMAHNPWSEVRGDAQALRQTAEVLDRVGESLINVYSVRTKKSREELKDMMNKTTWYTAEEALANGFADEIDKKFVVAASIHGESAYFNDQQFSLGIFSMAPPLPVLSTAPVMALADPVTPEITNKKEDEVEDSVKDVAELQAKHPDIYQAAVTVGINSERTRLKSIDEISNTIADDLVAKAKYETPISAETLAFQALKADSGKGLKHMANREEELANNDSVAAAALLTEKQTKVEADNAEIDAIANAANSQPGRSAK